MRIPIALVALASTALLAQEPKHPPARSAADDAFAKLAAQYDADKDGRITSKEYPRGREQFANLDRDGDGVITRADFAVPPRRPGASKSPRVPTPKLDAAPKLPKAGDIAPDFALPMLGMKDTTVKLSSFAGKQPVALIFGSYT